MDRKVTARALLALIALMLLGACSSENRAASGANETGRPIIVASFNFSESEILAEIYAAALRQNGFPVKRLADVASCEIMQPALQQGQADLAPEYLGSSLTCLRGAASAVSRDPSIVHEQLEVAFSKRGVDVLDFAPAQDKNVIVVTKATSDRYGLDSIGDLPAVASALSFGGPPECATRPLCLEGLENVYGIRFKSFVTLDASGPLTLGALKRGEVDVALFFSTHPALSDRDLVVLRDDEKLQPPENIVPVIRSSVVRSYGDRLSEVINAVTERITTSVLRRLNEKVDVLGEKAPEVAQQWLEDEANIP